MLSPLRHLRRYLLLLPWFYCCQYILPIITLVSGANDLWPLDRPDGMPSIQSLEVMCGKDHMDVHLTFSQPFEGIVSSKGQHGDPRCVYVPPSTGQTFFSFRIAYARCGTKPDLHGQFYENTVVVQYDKDLLEVWDEAKRLRCEWFNDYEKTASKPPMVIADLDVIQLDFRGDNVDCWMEIQHGKGPWAPPVSGIVPLGSTLTLVVAINDYRGEFDMRVKSCVASDGGGHLIQLSDEFGCVLRPKMISRFLKAKGADERASVITYAFFHAFKFPDALSVHIKCKVEICRHGCLDHCQIQPDKVDDVNPDLYHHGPVDRKDEGQLAQRMPDPVDSEMLYDDLDDNDEESSDEQDDHYQSPIKMPLTNNETTNSIPKHHQDQQQTLDEYDDKELDITAVPHKEAEPYEKFPHGPRTLDDLSISPPIGTPRAFPEDNIGVNNKPPIVERLKRKRRSIVISDRKARSADVGVSGLYDVISEADLAFSPSDNRAEAVTVFQGRIREEVVYGICMPVPGFSVLFVLVAVSAVVSALVAGTLLYRYQLQKERLAEQARHHTTAGSIPMGLFSGWFLRIRSAGAGGGSGGVGGVGAPIPLDTNGTTIDSSLTNGKTKEQTRNCD